MKEATDMYLKAKFSSRKFWLVVLNTAINLIAFFVMAGDPLRIVPLSLTTFGIVAFVVSEAVVDSARIDSSVIHHVVYDEDGIEHVVSTEPYKKEIEDTVDPADTETE